MESCPVRAMAFAASVTYFVSSSRAASGAAARGSPDWPSAAMAGNVRKKLPLVTAASSGSTVVGPPIRPRASIAATATLSSGCAARRESIGTLARLPRRPKICATSQMTAGTSLASASASRCGSNVSARGDERVHRGRETRFVRTIGTQRSAERGDRSRTEASERGHDGAPYHPAPIGEHRDERVHGRRAALREALHLDNATAVVGRNGERGFPRGHRFS